VVSLRTQGDELKKNVDQFDGLTEELRQTNAQLETANSNLKGNVQGLAVQNDKLEETLKAMTEQYDILEEGMKKFDDLRETLSAVATDADENMSEMIGKTMDKFNQMDTLLHDNEIVLLQQLAADVEFLDESEGMSEREWKRFHTRLPKRYKRIVDAKGWTFESLDHNGDGSIDTHELAELINTLIKEESASDV